MLKLNKIPKYTEIITHSFLLMRYGNQSKRLFLFQKEKPFCEYLSRENPNGRECNLKDQETCYKMFPVTFFRM